MFIIVCFFRAYCFLLIPMHKNYVSLPGTENSIIALNDCLHKQMMVQKIKANCLESILRMESDRVQVLLNKDADRILSHSQLII